MKVYLKQYSKDDTPFFIYTEVSFGNNEIITNCNERAPLKRLIRITEEVE